MKIKFDKNYFTDGVTKGISCYENYRWIPELTYPMAHAFYNFLKLRKNSNVLEYGCANGFLVKCLKDFGVNSFGVDISSYAIENSLPDISDRLSIIKNNNLKNCLNKIKFKKKFFDWTISKDVFEHINQKDLKIIINQISNVSKKLFVIVPLGDNSKYRIKQYHMDKTHIIIKDEIWWENLFNVSGFELKKILYRVDGIKDKWYKYNNRGNGFFLLDSKNI